MSYTDFIRYLQAGIDRPGGLGVQYLIHLLAGQSHTSLIKRLVLALSSSVAVTETQKILFVDALQNPKDCFLDKLVFQRADSDRTLPSVGLGNVDSL